MKLPQYYIFGAQPVKIVSTENGGMEVFAYDWKTGEFEVAPSDYLVRALTGEGDVDRYNENDFDEYVKELRKKLGKE